MRKVYSNNNKEVYVDDKTGTEKVVYTKDPEHLAAVSERLTLQPYGSTEAEFFGKYKHLKKVSGGKIIDKNDEKDRAQTRNWEIDQYERKQRERMKIGNEKYKKYY